MKRFDTLWARSAFSLLVLAFSSTAALAVYQVDIVNGTSGNCTDLIAGQNILVGEGCWEVTGDIVQITYTTTGGWELTEAHAWLGCEANGYPQTNKGNPKIGLFPYASGDITGATTYTLMASFIDLPCLSDTVGVCDPDVSIYAMAHAAVQLVDESGNVIQGETAWTNGPRVVEKGSWATSSTLSLKDDDCDGGPDLVNCFSNDTMYAFSETGSLSDNAANNGGHYNSNQSTCFLEPHTAYDPNQIGQALPHSVDEPDSLANRWGWYSTIGASGETYTMYAGAGQCSLTSGAAVGTATVTVDLAGDYTISVDMYADSGIKTTHVYVGCDIAPVSCNGSVCDYSPVANGKFPSIVEADEYTYGGANIHHLADPGCEGGDTYMIIHGESQVLEATVLPGEVCPSGSCEAGEQWDSATETCVPHSN